MIKFCGWKIVGLDILSVLVLFFTMEITVLYSQVNVIPAFLVSRFQAYGGFLFRTRSNTQIHNTHA